MITQREIELLLMDIREQCKHRNTMDCPYDPCSMCSFEHLCHSFPDDWNLEGIENASKEIKRLSDLRQ